MSKERRWGEDNGGLPQKTPGMYCYSLCPQPCSSLHCPYIFPLGSLEQKMWWSPKLYTDAFELWCWRRLLRVPRTSRRSNQSILKEISPGCLLEGLMVKLKLQYFGHLMWRVVLLEKTWCWEGLGAGGEGDDRGWDGWMASPTRWAWVWVNSGVCDGQGGLACWDSWSRKEMDMTEQLNWTDGQGILACCSMRGRRVGHSWATELIEEYLICYWGGKKLFLYPFRCVPAASTLNWPKTD